MQKDKNSKKDSKEKLRKILDNIPDKDSPSKNEKYLRSLKRRLGTSSSPKQVIKKEKTEPEPVGEEDSLKPKVIIYPREGKKVIEFTEIEEEKTEPEEDKQIIMEPSPAKENKFEDEDIFEIKKPEVPGPQFAEVKPKEFEKFEKKITVEEKNTIADQELTEWESIDKKTPKEPEVEKETPEWEPIEQVKDESKDTDVFEKVIEEEIVVEKPKIEDKKEIVNNFCHECGNKLDSESNFCANCGTPVVKPSDSKTKKKIKELDETPEFIPILPIKKEEEEEKQILEEDSLEIKEEKIKDVPVKIEEDIYEVEEPIIDEKEISEEKLIEEEISEETGISKDTKIKAFEELSSVDEETAILLYDNGFTNIDNLKEATFKDITKIKGIKRKKAKNIKKEIDNKIVEDAEVKPIIMGETAEAELTEDQIKEVQEEVEEEKIPKPVELSSKSSEWSPVEESDKEDILEEDIPEEPKVIEEEKQKVEEHETWEEFPEQAIIEEQISEEPTIDDDVKIKAFKELKSVNNKTAILLYDNGFTSVDALVIASVKDLSKIEGIKKNTIKRVKKELEQKSEWEPIEIEEDEIFDEVEPEELEAEQIDEKIIEKPEVKEEIKEEEIFDEEEIIDEKSEQIDEKIIDFEPVESEEKFIEEEEVEDVPPIIIEDDDIFKNINSIDTKISRLLKGNGINSIDALRKATIKDLTKIKGIRRKIAKEIKKEVGELPIEQVEEEVKNEILKHEEETHIKEDGEWEIFDEDNISDKHLREVKGYMHKDYTLYEKEIKTKSGKKQIVRFFSKGDPDEGEPIQLPDGYEVKENKKTGLPYLKKKK